MTATRRRADDDAPARRLRIAWFSPLPPQRSGIADNVVPVLEVLRAGHDLELWAPEDAPVDTLGLPARRYALPPLDAPEGDAPGRWRVDWGALNACDAAVYHVGNHPGFHGDIWRIADRHPGIVVLHDEALQHLFAAVLRGSGRPAGDRRYLRAMARWHGEEGAEVARALLAGRIDILEAARRCPLTGLAMRGAAAAVVHSPAFLGRLAAVAAVPVAYLPLPFPAGPPAPAPPAAARPPRAVMMGHLGANRCLPQVLEALADPALAAWHLLILGEVAPDQDVAGWIARHGLEGRVTLRGYLPEEELRRALREADVAINFRNPTMGEASASQLTLWDAGLPVLASRTGWYATLPEGATMLVAPGEEVAGVREHLLAFARDPAPYLAMGRAGRAVLERDHAPSAYAAGLVQLAGGPPGGARRALAPRLGERIAEACPFLGPDDEALLGGVAAALAATLGGRG